eukprot:694620_1
MQSKYFCCHLRISSKSLTHAVAELLGCDPRRKTFDLQFPDDLDSGYFPSLIRGIVDGDGCWCMNLSCRPQITFIISSASVSFLRSIKAVINKHCLNTKKDRGTIRRSGAETAQCFALVYCDTMECQTIGEWMYQPQ